MKDTAIVIPTYNEVKTIGPLVRNLKSLGVGDVIVIDDGRDGTTRIAIDEGARVINPAVRLGFADSLRMGLKRSIDLGYAYTVTMDADGEHDPAVIPDMRRRMWAGMDVLVRSRFCLSHSFHGYRTLISHAATFLARGAVRRCSLTDMTTGFRCYRNTALKSILDDSHATDFPVQIEILGRMILAGATVIESPSRYRLTKSDFQWRMILEGLRVVYELGQERIRHGRKSRNAG